MPPPLLVPVGKRTPQGRKNNWPVYIGLGTAVIAGGILLAFFMAMNRANKAVQAIPDSNDQVARTQKPPPKPCRSHPTKLKPAIMTNPRNLKVMENRPRHFLPLIAVLPGIIAVQSPIIRMSSFHPLVKQK